MKCPRTGTDLKPIKVGGIEVDISEACGGVFFDNQELAKFLGDDSLRGSALVKHLTQFEGRPINLEKRINCPRCPESVMMRRFESPQKIVEIDECPSCAGIWLDFGELSEIRKNSKHQRPNNKKVLIQKKSDHIVCATETMDEDEDYTRLENSLDKAFQVVGQYFNF